MRKVKNSVYHFFTSRVLSEWENLINFDIGPTVELSELFPSQFMTENTSYETFSQFASGSPWTIEKGVDLPPINNNELDQYVNEVTEFTSWQEMVNLAAREETIRTLPVWAYC